MEKTTQQIFSQVDLERIEKAVKDAESLTAGEIVPFVVQESDAYEGTMWKAGLLMASISIVVMVVISKFTDIWISFDVLDVGLIALLSALAGMLLGWLTSPIKRWLTNDRELGRRVALRAEEAFISEEVFNTRDRTGILIFISLFEHKVLVIGDSGINAKVSQSEWNGIVSLILNGIKSGNLADGLTEAIKQAGVLLQKEGVEIRPDDKNELKDGLRFRER